MTNKEYWEERCKDLLFLEGDEKEQYLEGLATEVSYTEDVIAFMSYYILLWNDPNVPRTFLLQIQNDFAKDRMVNQVSKISNLQQKMDSFQKAEHKH